MHRNIECNCEQARMVNIGQSFGGIPVYFIRWNPDNYAPENSRKNPEIVKKRHILVGDYIQGIIDRKVDLPKALVSVFYMYYDGWNDLHNEQWHILTAFE
jgi:hypothetical protein